MPISLICNEQGRKYFEVGFVLGGTRWREQRMDRFGDEDVTKKGLSVRWWVKTSDKHYKTRTKGSLFTYYPNENSNIIENIT
ncbi:hypothetical protein HYD67_00900 [Mycoplasmopsis bovis]|nr:hypothetical protein [Mycoplasmopsis bovis]QQH54804.1 hypothetical protein HYD67_00900 [Mycoplasmopsis bovis]